MRVPSSPPPSQLEDFNGVLRLVRNIGITVFAGIAVLEVDEWLNSLSCVERVTDAYSHKKRFVRMMESLLKNAKQRMLLNRCMHISAVRSYTRVYTEDFTDSSRCDDHLGDLAMDMLDSEMVIKDEIAVVSKTEGLEPVYPHTICMTYSCQRKVA